MVKAKHNLLSDRSNFKPFNYPWAYDAWIKHEQSHWLHTEVPMSEDVKDWQSKLSESEKGFLTNIFRFFVQGDIDVAGGYVNNYLPYFKQPEIRMMLAGFGMSDEEINVWLSVDVEEPVEEIQEGLDDAPDEQIKPEENV